MGKKKLINLFNNLSNWIILFTLILFPILFLTTVTDPFVFPKQLLIIFSTIILIIIWNIRMIIVGRVSILSNPLNLPLFLFGSTIAVSALLSQNRYDSLIQTTPLLSLLIFSFLLINSIDRKVLLERAIFALFMGGIISSIVSILYFLRIYLFPLGDLNTPLFTSFGSPIQHIGYLLPLVVFSGVYLYGRMQENEFERLTIDGSSVYFAFAAFVIFCGISLNIHKIFFAVDKPIMLPMQYGIQIATASLGQDTQRQLPSLLFGSGFGTFGTNFTRFKPMSFNLEQQMWNLNISFSSSFILELVATAGMLGLISFLNLIIRFIKKSRISISNPLFAAITTNILLTFFIPYSLTFVFLTFILLAMYISFMNIEEFESVYPVSLSLVKPSSGILSLSSVNESKTMSRTIPIILAIFLMLPLSVVGFYSFKYLKADIDFKRAQNPAVFQDGQKAYDLTRNAIASFPYKDDYFRLFSQINLSLANSITSDLKAGEQPTAEMQQTVFALLQQSVNSARSAVVVAPLTVSNWTNLGKIYRSLIGIGQNAEQFAVASYQEAIKLNQYDPQNYIDSGGVFFQLGRFDEAMIQFQNAVTLMPNLPNAHYNLGHSFESKGEFEKALQEYEIVKDLTENNNESVAKIEGEITALKAKLQETKIDDQELQVQESVNPTEPADDTIRIGSEEVLKIQAPPEDLNQQINEEDSIDKSDINR